MKSAVSLSAPVELAREVRADLTAWLFEHALPLWWRIGTDHDRGGFFEKIGRDGKVIDDPRRTRVVGRQIFVFATATTIGWKGPAAEAVAHGIDYLRRFCIAEDGSVVFATRPDGHVVDGRFDLYDMAFALFGLSAAHQMRPSPELADLAARMRARLIADRSHPGGGYEETVPSSLPLKANPHMHLFEAALAWAERCRGTSAEAGWRAMADGIGELCLAHLVDPANGCLREFFDAGWCPMPGDAGRQVEPGHQFEWAWLLLRWSRGGRADAARVARRLVEIGETWGTDQDLGITFNELNDDLSVRDRRFRLWPQTERIKAWLALADIAETNSERAVALVKVAAAGKGLKKFFATDVPGTWIERLNEDGSGIVDASPASSLYHITCAIAEMWNSGVLDRR